MRKRHSADCRTLLGKGRGPRGKFETTEPGRLSTGTKAAQKLGVWEQVQKTEVTRLVCPSGSGEPRPGLPPRLRLASPPAPAPQRHLLDVSFHTWRTGQSRFKRLLSLSWSPELDHAGPKASKALAN